MNRRRFLQAALASSVLPARLARAQAGAQVVVIGGGFGGATTIRYLREFAPRVRVTLIEPNAEFIACPMSNRSLHGMLSLRDLSRPYADFAARHGIQWLREAALAIDPPRREVVLAGGRRVSYDRLVLAPGVDFDYRGLKGLETPEAQQHMPHAWKAGAQTVTLRNRLHALPDGATIAMHVPKVPYRCPPGPYERASLIAYYLKSNKPKSKLLLFDSNPEIQSKRDLYLAAWKEHYAGRLEYIPNAEIAEVNAAGGVVDFAVHGKVRADLWNLIPPQLAGEIARSAVLANAGGKWCGVDFLSYESTAAKNIHVIGDAIAGSPGMPKSGHMANQEGKVCAAAIAQLLAGQAPVSKVAIANTCYSFVTHRDAMHVASVHRYDPASKQMVPVKGAGGLSPAASAVEGLYAMAWFSNIMADTLG